MSIELIRPPFPLPPLSGIKVATLNSARMEITFTPGVESVTLSQRSALSGEDRVYVWDEAALRELASALEQAADELESTRKAS